MHVLLNHTYINNGVQIRKCCERIPCLQAHRDTVVGETLPCVAESSNSSDRIAVTLIWRIFQIHQFAKMFPSPIKPTVRYTYVCAYMHIHE